MPTHPCTHHWLLSDQTTAAYGKCVNCGNERFFSGGQPDGYYGSTQTDEHGREHKNNIWVSKDPNRFNREEPVMADEVA